MILSRCTVSLFFGVLTLAVGVSAQTNAPAASGADATGAGQPPASEAVKLDAFQVQADSDHSYGALNSNSITGFNAQLAHLPISADIYDQAFMQDTAATSVEQLLQTYSAGVGYGGADPASSAANQYLDRNGSAGLTVRGLNNGRIQRDGFMTAPSTGTGYTSTFDLDRVELINGPQALLYGNGAGGGVVNQVSKQARFDSPTGGSLLFQVDQYGQKMGQFDLNEGMDNLAVRIAGVNQTVGARRVDLGGPVKGLYTQVAARIANTTVRFTIDQQQFERQGGATYTVTTASNAEDARNGQNLHYLLATDQINAAANGAASGGGTILGGLLNWNNVDMVAGSLNGHEDTENHDESVQVDSQWTSWLSTQLMIGYQSRLDDIVNPGVEVVDPRVTSNPTGTWAFELTSSPSEGDIWEPSRSKAIRFNILSSNPLFGGKAHSQSILGADFNRIDTASIQYGYYTPDTHVPLPRIYIPITAVPVIAPFAPHVSSLTYQGVTYVREIENPSNPALVSPADPNGVILGGSQYLVTKDIEKGFYGANYTQWLDNKLDTLVGFRLASTNTDSISYVVAPNTVSPFRQSALSFNLGTDYALLPWLSPYAALSDSFNPPTSGASATDPLGAHFGLSRALGEEAGFKLAAPGGKLSGSLALYHASTKNEQYQITGSLENDINPSGLNGRYNSPGAYVNADRDTRGIQAAITATPTATWRLRLSAAIVQAKVNNGTEYNQVYNDGFYENAAGQVTYADGTVVYVPPAYNAKGTLAYTPANAPAGAIPLTVLAMSTPGNAYFANPTAINGQINSSAAVVSVLRVVDPTHGSILTGQTGLPISQIQINPTLAGLAALPGTIVTSRAGDKTAGYPEYSMILTQVYTVPSGWFKGVELGGTLSGGWENLSYYYYPNGVSDNGSRQLFLLPTLTRFDAIIGYTRKFKRVVFTTQLNINNMFNQYKVVILPNEITGYAGPNNATFNQQPREYIWTNTFKF